MNDLRIINLSEAPELIEKASEWFHDKWDLPSEAYRESMAAGADSFAPLPRWYVVLDRESRIVAGAGLIENDFHDRKDLSPNVCALYVEPEYRKIGVAQRLLELCRAQAGRSGFTKLYLVTDHTEFYEKCGWEFLTLVNSDENEQERMYVIAVG